jgi:hypothetical protein
MMVLSRQQHCSASLITLLLMLFLTATTARNKKESSFCEEISVLCRDVDNNFFVRNYKYPLDLLVDLVDLHLLLVKRKVDLLDLLVKKYVNPVWWCWTW